MFLDNRGVLGLSPFIRIAFWRLLPLAALDAGFAVLFHQVFDGVLKALGDGGWASRGEFRVGASEAEGESRLDGGEMRVDVLPVEGDRDRGACGD
jgi:hypothetical protein